jgi:hypothetical protein
LFIRKTLFAAAAASREAEEPAAEEPAPAAAAAAASEEEEDSLTAAQVEKLTVAKLKEELSKRSLDRKGLKAVLKKRLLEAIAAR